MRLTLGEYRTRYSQLLSGADKVTIEQAGTVASYITNIANAMERSAEEFDLLSVEGFKLLDGRLKIVATNTIEINKKLMEFFSVHKASTKELPSSLDSQLAKIAKEQAEKDSRIAQSKIQEWRTVMQQRMTDFHNACAECSKWESKQIALMSGTEGLSIKIVESIKAGITSDEFFKFDRIQGDQIILKTSTFNVNYFEPEHKINDHFETGPFEIVLSLTNGVSIKVQATEACVKSNGYIHPHIAGSSICLGNGSAAYAEAAARLDIAAMLRIIKAILTTYNSNSPYREFRHFKKEWEDSKKKREILLNEESLKKAYEERVSSSEEEWFDELIAN